MRAERGCPRQRAGRRCFSSRGIIVRRWHLRPGTPGTRRRPFASRRIPRTGRPSVDESHRSMSVRAPQAVDGSSGANQ